MQRSDFRIALSTLLLVLASGACDPADEPDPVPRSAQVAPAFEGELVTRIADLHDGTSRTFDVLVHEGRAVEVVLPPTAAIERGSIVRAWGRTDAAGVLAVDELEVVAPPATPRKIDPDPRAPRRIAMILTTWTPGGGLPNSEGKTKMFTGDTSTNNYYREISYGKEKLVGEVFGPYQIDDPGSCAADLIALRALAAAKDAGHTSIESDYEQFMYHFPSRGDCGWAGLANVGAPDNPAQESWYNGASGCVVLAQEIAHNYGLKHSHSYDCTYMDQDVPFSDECTFEEYGNPYDPMGGGCGHMSIFQKGYMGWLEGCNMVTATSDGLFNLLPTELPCNGPQGLRVATDDGRWFYLEYRRPLGLFDDPSPEWSQGLSGVMVHVANNFNGGGSPNGYILDMFDGPGALMLEGDSYTDIAGTVTFEVVEALEDRAVIQVTFPGGGSGDPHCMDDSVPVMEMGAYGSLECADEPIQPDITAPTVTITYPEDGEKFEPGSSFEITAEAQDDEGVYYAELYLGNTPQYRVYGPPFAWPVNGIPTGEYELGVAASDGPNLGLSQVVHITVAEGATDPEETGEEGGGDTGEDSGGSTGTDEGEAGAGEASGGGCGCAVAPAASGLPVVWALAAIGRRRKA